MLWWPFAIALCYSVICSVMCYRLAKLKGYSAENYAVAGFFLGLLALVYAAGLPQYVSFDQACNTEEPEVLEYTNASLTATTMTNDTAKAMYTYDGSTIQCQSCGANQVKSNLICKSCKRKFDHPFLVNDP